MNLRKRITIGLLFLGSILGVAKAAQKPNILWITSEDNGVSWISCYGGKNTKTPAIDQLAKEGFRYLYCFDNAAVCAPTLVGLRECMEFLMGLSRCGAGMRFRMTKSHTTPIF